MARASTSQSAGEPVSSRHKLLVLLKTRGPQTAPELASALGVSAVAVRQHLATLSEQGLTAPAADTGGGRSVGRPARRWRATARADAQFADRHSALAVELLSALQRTLPAGQLSRVTRERTHRLIDSYQRRMPSRRLPLSGRVAALAALRRQDGYLAEAVDNPDGSVDLFENHCCIERAARVCPQLCSEEQFLLSSVLGGDVAVTRLDHIVAGDRCCRYRFGGPGAAGDSEAGSEDK